MRDYRKIKAWEYGDELTVLIYRTTRGFPSDERYGLTSQLRRAAYSVPSNIAEGARRNSHKDYLHFLYIARGSLTEVEYFCHLANRLDYLSTDEHSKFTEQINRTFARLHGLIQSVEKEAGTLRKVIAGATSLLALTLAKSWLGT